MGIYLPVVCCQLVKAFLMEAALRAINIFIVEDYEITRVGLRLTLGHVPDFTIIGEAADGQSAVEAVNELCPDVVLMDIGLPVMDGIDATLRIKSVRPETRVVMLTSHHNDRDIFAALGAGADGYCLKEASSTQLVGAIRAVAEGAAWLDAGIASRVLKACASAAPSMVSVAPQKATAAVGKSCRNGCHSSPLSQRELDVLLLVVEGKSNQEIADRLILSVETVKTHMRHIMEKLAVSDRTQAAVKAMREGLV
jgi:DNA-binding NarL/FixJ family response regulator